MQPLLEGDHSLFCISAWNDNGLKGNIYHEEELQRTNFFPGLGWMMNKRLWEEYRLLWPNGYWDDWMREPQQRKQRDCIHPSISRTKTFGRIGSSGGQVHIILIYYYFIYLFICF